MLRFIAYAPFIHVHSNKCIIEPIAKSSLLCCITEHEHMNARLSQQQDSKEYRTLVTSKGGAPGSIH
ncbi:hypothetical protein DUNSADRAFT_6826 [Dunaliella salina]|uniref:Encoded protein n=1 Tax=Dunaliella salina TaxID=3046 RepID=A0ABQ7GMJ6_DUNSA|nr:hypothetical protein DUNSADRAFT_6826 [Dunaliella salina]|eukprot:KAF5835839.1 hypothetical protein DUNSADRAFT_6826 [Dunaliella salina]